MKIKKLFIAALAIAALTSCKKDKNDNDNTPKKLYLLSNEQDATTGKKIIRYYIDGVPTSLGDGSTVSLFGNDMDISGNDVYVLANKITNTGISSNVIYKNGIEIQSIPANNDFYPNCIAVNGSDIYLSGVGQDAIPANFNVKLWKNGTLTNITSGTTTANCRIYDMVVDGSDVYLAGYESNSNTNNIKNAKYWKNGTGISVTNNTVGSSAELHRIVVNGSDVYCVGMFNNKATIWKNGAATTLNTTNNAYCFGLAISGNDVYAAGSVDDGTAYHAAYWKNGVQTNLDLLNSSSTSDSYVYGIAVNGNDVYVIGEVELPNNKYKAVYWKNTIETILPTGSGNSAGGYRMVLK